MLPAPSLADLDWRDEQSIALADEPFDIAEHHPRGVPLPQPAPWPRPSLLSLESSATVALSVPAQSIFEIQENPRATAQSLLPPSRHVDRAAPTVGEKGGIARPIAANADNSRSAVRGKSHLRATRKPGALKFASHGKRNVAGAHRGPLKHLVQVKKKRSV